jgi:hypothetical protein
MPSYGFPQTSHLKMTNFCTLFDSNYLSRGLIMYESLKETSILFHLYIFAFDDLTYKILKKLELENTTVISLYEFESQELLNIKDSRTRTEYCWTCTSSVIRYVLENYKVPSCTYIDADLYFYGSPSVLLDEIPSSKSVLITEHRFSKLNRAAEQKRAGRFCVQFITFKNQQDSKEILDKWISQCIDWCYNRYENGKFGDQKYLETWPVEYPVVYILENQGGGVAPWNVNRYKFNRIGNKIYLTVKKSALKTEIIFFHFHFVKILPGGRTDLGWNRLSKEVLNILYLPYIRKIIEKDDFLKSFFSDYYLGYAPLRSRGLKNTVKYLIKKVTGYNLIKVPSN